MRYQPSPRRGFTLIEILITIAIVAIIAGVGMLSLYGFRSANSLDTEARELVATLKSAQEHSIGQDTGSGTTASRWGVYFDLLGTDRDTYYLYQVNESQPADLGTVLDQHTLVGDYSLGLPGGAPTTTIIFAKATGIPSASTTITITSARAQDTKRILISASGKIDYQ